jgi:hypothetical protein
MQLFPYTILYFNLVPYYRCWNITNITRLRFISNHYYFGWYIPHLLCIVEMFTISLYKLEDVNTNFA